MLSQISNNTSQDYVYYNVTINGPTYQLNSGNGPTATTNYCQYNVDLGYPILPKMEDYYASVIRFSLPASCLPLTIPDIAIYQQYPNQTLLNTDPNFTVYSFWFNFGSSYYRGTAEWIAQDSTQLTPLAPSNNNGRQVISPYYYCYSYQWMLYLWNTAIANAWALLYAAHSSVGSTPPFILYTPTTQLFSLIVPYSMITTGTAMITNSPTINYIQGIPNQIIPTPSANSFADQQGPVYEFAFLATNLQTLGYALPGTTVSTPPTYLQLNSEYICSEYWPVLNGIVLTSPTLKINYESLNQGYSNQTSAIPSFIPILQDYIVNLDNPNDPRSIIIYNATIYRLVDLTSNQPLNKISINAYWTDSYNNLYPITLSNGEQASFKLMFVRKDAIKGNSIQLKNI